MALTREQRSHSRRPGGRDLASTPRSAHERVTGAQTPRARTLALSRTTLECTYRTVGKVRRPFTPIRTLLAHYSHSRRIVFTAILTLFAHYSHGLTRFAQYSHGRTLFAHYSHGRTLFARSHTIRTPFARSHTIRAVHTLFAPSSHQIRRLFAPVRTPVTLFARWGRAHSHSFTQYSHSSHPFAFVNVR
jgi:hypothetical protein